MDVESFRSCTKQFPEISSFRSHEELSCRAGNHYYVANMYQIERNSRWTNFRSCIGDNFELDMFTSNRYAVFYWDDRLIVFGMLRPWNLPSHRGVQNRANGVSQAQIRARIKRSAAFGDFQGETSKNSGKREHVVPLRVKEKITKSCSFCQCMMNRGEYLVTDWSVDIFTIIPNLSNLFFWTVPLLDVDMPARGSPGPESNDTLDGWLSMGTSVEDSAFLIVCLFVC